MRSNCIHWFMLSIDWHILLFYSALVRKILKVTFMLCFESLWWSYSFVLCRDACQYVTDRMCKSNQLIAWYTGIKVRDPLTGQFENWDKLEQGVITRNRRTVLRVWRSGDYDIWHMMQWCCEILLKKFRGKEIRPGKSGDTVNRGTVNRGFTV